MTRAYVPLDAFQDPLRTPALIESGDRELVKLRLIATRRNPYSWMWASLLVTLHVIPALLTARKGAVLVPMRMAVVVRRCRRAQLALGCLTVVGAVVELARQRYLGIVSLLLFFVVLATLISLFGIRATYDPKDRIVTIKHLAKRWLV